MDEVSLEGRKLIDHVRRHDGLDASRREQLKRGVMLGVGSAVGVGALGVAGHAAAAVPAASAAQLTSSAGAVGVQLTFGKLLLIAATGGAIGTGLVVATLPPEPKPQPPLAAQAPSRTVHGTPSLRNAPNERPAISGFVGSSAAPPTAQFAPAAQASAVATTGSLQASTPTRVRPAVSPSVSAPPAPENSVSRAAPLPSVGSFNSPTPALDQELQTIRTAQRALHEGKGQEVLNSLNQSKPPQVLTEEYAATRVFALCSAGRIAEGQSAARAFLNTYPRSPLRPKVANACSGK